MQRWLSLPANSALCGASMHGPGCPLSRAGVCPSLPGLSRGQKTSAAPWRACSGVGPAVPQTEAWEPALALPGEASPHK